MNRLDNARRAHVVRCLVEGCSIRSAVRMTGVAKNTVAKLLVELGAVCTKYMDDTMRDLPCKRIQVDEIWQFVGCKEKNVTAAKIGRDGICRDVWAWTAIDAHTKLVPCFMLGRRDPEAARDFMEDLASRLTSRVHLTGDGPKAYLTAVKAAFGNDIDFAQLVKIYGTIDSEGRRRYPPATCIGCESHTVTGSPDPDHIGTSYVERAKLTMRMSMRRFTRLANAFSKKVENHAAMIGIYFMWYNFGRNHRTLKMTPAMKAGIADHAWTVEEVIGLLEAVEPKSNRPAVSN